MSIHLPTIVVVHYAIAKGLIRRISNKETISVDLLAGVLCFVTVTIMAILLLPFLIFRTCLHITLMIIYRKLYGGLLKGLDTVFEIHEKGDIINIVAIYSSKEDTQVRIKKLKTYIDQVHNSTYRFGCSIKNFCGYRYFIKRQYNSEDIFQIVNVNGESSITESALYEYIERHCSTIEQNCMWRAHGFLQPIQWRDTSEEVKQYAIILTFRHSLGDVPSIIGTLKKFLSVDCTEIKESEVSAIPYKPKLTLRNAYLHSNPMFRSMEGEKLIVECRSDWYLTAYIEPKPKYFPIIKALKKKLNVGFTDVIGGAICSSVKDFILQRKVETDTITGFSIVRVFNHELKEIVNGTYNFEEPANTSSALTYEIPCRGPDRSMKDQILSFHLVSKIMQTSADYIVPYSYCNDIGSYMPTWYLRYIMKSFWSGTHFHMSNLVGLPRNVCGTCTVDDVFFSARYSSQYGFVVCLFSYDHRFGMTIGCNRGYVRSREELQTVLDNTLKYLNEAEKEILSSKDMDTERIV